jgi:uncharacterized membrane protein
MIYLILILGLILRLISINQSLWLDEATTAIASQLPIADFFNKFMHADFHPPLYYLVVSLWSTVFGYSEIALRVPSVIFGMLTVYIVYLIAKQIKITWPVVPALFLATSSLHIYYSQEARMYSLATLLVSYLVLLYLRKKWFLFSIILPLIFLTDYVSFLILPALFMFTFFNKRSDIKKFLISCVPFVLTFITWLPFLSKQLTAGMSIRDSAWWNILGPVTLKNVALIPTKFMIGRVGFENKIIYGIVISIISVFFAYVIGRAKNKLIWYWFAGSLFLGIILSIFIPTLTYFRYLFILPAFYLLLSESKSKIFIVFVLIINLLASYFYLSWPRFQRENWREIAKIIGNEKVVFPASSQHEALIYYSDAESHGKDNQIISNQQLTTNSYQTVWLSRYVWNIFDPNDNARIQIEELGYNWQEEVNLNGVVFWKYTK